MNKKDYRFFHRTKYTYAEYYIDRTINGPPVFYNQQSFDNVDEAIDYAHERGFTFRDSKGLYRNPEGSRYWAEIHAKEVKLIDTWKKESFYEYFDTTKYVGERHMAAHAVAQAIKEVVGDKTSVFKNSLADYISPLPTERYWKLVTPSEENKDFSNYLVAKNALKRTGRLYGNDVEGFAKFLRVGFTVAVEAEVEKIIETHIRGQKDKEPSVWELLRDIFEYVNEEYDSEWL